MTQKSNSLKIIENIEEWKHTFTQHSLWNLHLIAQLGVFLSEFDRL